MFCSKTLISAPNYFNKTAGGMIRDEQGNWVNMTQYLVNKNPQSIFAQQAAATPQAATAPPQTAAPTPAPPAPAPQATQTLASPNLISAPQEPVITTDLNHIAGKASQLPFPAAVPASDYGSNSSGYDYQVPTAPAYITDPGQRQEYANAAAAYMSGKDKDGTALAQVMSRNPSPAVLATRGNSAPLISAPEPSQNTAATHTYKPQARTPFNNGLQYSQQMPAYAPKPQQTVAGAQPTFMPIGVGTRPKASIPLSQKNLQTRTAPLNIGGTGAPSLISAPTAPVFKPVTVS